MKNKKWVVLLIVAFPSLFWLILETSTINSRRLPFYGPKTARAAGDTLFHRVSDQFMRVGDDTTGIVTLSPEELPLYTIVFLDEKYRPDAYRLTGLWEYLNYKKSKIAHIPVVLIGKTDADGHSKSLDELRNLGVHENVRFFGLPAGQFEDAVKEHFLEKPYYIDYSFFLLVDKGRHIRGYYDSRYVSEFKRLAEEYQHLRLKEEKQKMINANEIRSN